jgi:hypothetical protein
VLRAGFKTDNGNLILDVHGLSITDPVALETHIDGITGVVTVGLFARRRPTSSCSADPTACRASPARRRAAMNPSRSAPTISHPFEAAP